jgi:3-hydroxyisobutyrate dehydrogenase
MSKVAFLGLGAMGSRMAANLVKAGHEVTVWNRSPAAMKPLADQGARTAASPRAAVEGAEFAITMLTDDKASETVWLDPKTGALAGMAKTAIALDSSTVSPGWIRALSGHMAAAGISFLDAPVSGTLPAAEGRQLIFMLGGETEAAERARPVLSAMAGAVHHVGPVGQGIAMKLAVNSLLAIQITSFAEAIGYMAKSGIAPSRALDLLQAMPVASPAATMMAKLMVAGDFAPRFPVALMAKDLGYAAQDAAALKSKTPVAASALKLFDELLNTGYGADNVTAAARLFFS